MSDLREVLRAVATQDGASVFGVADLEGLSARVPELFRDLPGSFSRAISMGVKLSDAVVEEIADRPTALYFHLYRQANYLLDRVAMRVAMELERAGYVALAVPASQIIEASPMRGHVSHREIAHAAGLGWWGRNNLLVSPEAGSRLRLVTVLTDAPLAVDSPLEADCGSCRACVVVCPAGAIKDDRREFDLETCYRKLCEFRRMPFIGQHICGVCVKACRPRKVRQVTHG